MKFKSIIISLLICAIVVALAAAFASSYPDGLEWIAAKMGFEGRAAESNIVNSPMADYVVPKMGGGTLSTATAGILGIVFVFSGTIFFCRVFVRRNCRSEAIQKSVS